MADGRKKGFTLAVRFLENYLKANGDPIELSREDALAFDDVRDAVVVNIERFWQDNLIEPKSKIPGAKPERPAPGKDQARKIGASGVPTNVK